MRERNPKTEIVVAVIQIVLVATRRARVLTVIVKRTAAHHAAAVTGPYSCKRLAPQTANFFWRPAARGTAPSDKATCKTPEYREPESGNVMRDGARAQPENREGRSGKAEGTGSDTPRARTDGYCQTNRRAPRGRLKPAGLRAHLWPGKDKV